MGQSGWRGWADGEREREKEEHRPFHQGARESAPASGRCAAGLVSETAVTSNDRRRARALLAGVLKCVPA